MSIINNKNLPLQEEEDDHNEEDYVIDMESSSKNPMSSPQTKEFEFQNMSLTVPSDKATINTADDLFYKGKLLPLLLLPSRRHMLRNITEAGTFDFTKMPLFEPDSNTYHSTPPTQTLNTPLDSCNISPSESCRASCELNPDDYFFEWSTELSGFVTKIANANNNTSRSCRKKLPWYSKKLKASRDYLKALFTKDTINCSSGRKSEEIPDKHIKIAKTKTSGTIAAIMKSNLDYYKDEGGCGINGNVIYNRRSFSNAIKLHSPTTNNKCLTSSDSSSSGASSFFSRTSSATEIEGSIEAAIDHCKKSCQVQ